MGTISKIIYVDFSGTITETWYGSVIGREVPHAFRVMLALEEAGHIIIINTSYVDDKDSINRVMQFINYHHEYEFKSQIQYSPEKIYGNWDLTRSDIFIDDNVYKTPTMKGVYSEKMVNWLEVEKQFIAANILPNDTN